MRGLKFLRSPFAMVLVAFLLRLLWILTKREYAITDRYWSGFEMANLARSLVQGHGFASPWGGATGPSAWTAPIYPWLIALTFRIFGVFSHGAALALLTLNSIFSALTCWTLYRIGRRVFGETVAVCTGWLWAIHPASVYFSVLWIWETSLSAFLLSAVFLVTLEMAEDDRLLSWLGYGVLWATAGLTNPAMLAWLPFSGCWLAYRLHSRGKRFLAPVLIGIFTFWITLTPWLIRDYVVLHKPILIRSDFGVELRGGNNSYSDGLWVRSYHPGNNRVLFAQYKSMGEVPFVSLQGRMARQWIMENPGEFLRLTCRRVVYFWTLILEIIPTHTNMLIRGMVSLLSFAGLWLALKQHLQGSFLFLTLLASYPVIYYIAFPTARYRHAIDPELLVLAVFGLVSLTEWLWRTIEEKRVKHAELVALEGADRG